MARETVQYGVSISYEEADEIMQHAREFVMKMKLAGGELDEKLVEAINRKKDELTGI